MNNLITLVKMQLKEKLNFKRLELEGVSAFRILVTVVGALLKFAIITAIFTVVLFVVSFLGLFSVTRAIPTTVMSIAFGILMITSIVSCTVGLTNSMYFSRDNAILLTLPCRPIQVYLSKLIIFFAYELKRSFNFMVPLFVAYFIISRYPIIAYLWLMFCFVFIALFTVAVASLLSVPAMWISNVFRQNRFLQIGTLVTMVSGLVVALFYAISLIPENLDLLATMPVTMNRMNNWLSNVYPEKFGWLYGFCQMFLGVKAGTVSSLFPIGEIAPKFFILLGINLLFLTLGTVIILPLFYKMASTPFEYLKKKVKPKKNRQKGKKVTTFFTEMTIAVKTDRKSVV